MKLVASEFEECRALMQWAAWKEREFPELRLLYHAGNEHVNTSKPGKMPVHVARALIGIKPGVFDYHLPISRGGYHGFWLEMKARGGKISKAQDAWYKAMMAEGHYVVIAWDWGVAAATILGYLQLPKKL